MKNKYERCKQLLTDNPKLSLRDFKNLTGLSKNVYYKVRNELYPKKPKKLHKKIKYNATEKFELENIALKITLKQKLKLELAKSLKRKGYINAKGTFIERM